MPCFRGRLRYIAQQAITQYEWIGAKDMIVRLAELHLPSMECLLAVGFWLPPLDSNQ